MGYTKLILYKSADFDTFNYASLYTKASGTFTNTETSIYSEIIGLASTTGFGGASLGNQTERYLMAVATVDYGEDPDDFDNFTSSDMDSINNNSKTINQYLADNSGWTITPSGHTSFSAVQTDLEDDGKHFVEYDHSGVEFKRSILLVDKNNLGGGSGSSSSSGTSLISWAHSSQSETDPNTLIDWDNQQISQVTFTDDATDWKTDLLSKVTAAGLNIDNLLVDYQLEKSIDLRNKNISFKDYVINKIN